MFSSWWHAALVYRPQRLRASRPVPKVVERKREASPQLVVARRTPGSRPLDDVPNFHEVIASSLLPDQHCLVALFFSGSRAVPLSRNKLPHAPSSGGVA